MLKFDEICKKSENLTFLKNDENQEEDEGDNNLLKKKIKFERKTLEEIYNEISDGLTNTVKKNKLD